MDSVGRWASGMSYGPVLSQTDLYLLDTELDLNPIIAHNGATDFHLIFNLSTGMTGGFNQEARDRDLPFTQKDEPATLPRVSTLILITELSPWCTVVTNENGVTMSDVCTTLWKDYTDNSVTESEFAALPPRLQEQVKRAAAAHNQSSWNQYYTPAQMPNRFRRVDWLREKVFFDGLRKRDEYSIQRLGYKAPNIFVVQLQI
ncbi:hypothetical protein HWV62_10627 [Athelia sp. TMB]|nr:hypothetical protein HWV62_16462 [Athelia sp. TMB]KAF7975011.1 hypothetical protein HWV62_10627 [Athelia sp. TMB]